MVIAIGEITIVNLDDVHISTTPPDDPVHDQLWLDTSTVPNVMKRWDAMAEEWVKASPTSAEDIGAETPEGAQDKADEAVREIADGEYPEGTFITGKSIYTPEVYAGHMHGFSGNFYELMAGDPEGPRLEMGEKPIASQVKVSHEDYAIASSYYTSQYPGDQDHPPGNAFDEDVNTEWIPAMDGSDDDPWIGQEFPIPRCIKSIRDYCPFVNTIGSLEYYDEAASAWIRTDQIELVVIQGGGWSSQSVNAGNVYAKKWRCQPRKGTHRVYELEFYDERFSPFVDGFATKTQKAFELNAAGIGTFEGFFSMDGHPAGVIHELGINAGGGYARWSNGWQICWMTFPTIENITPTSSSYGGVPVYRYDITNVMFPMEFFYAPTVLPGANPQGHGDMDTNSPGVSTSSCTIRVHSLSSFSLIYHPHYVAFGWWKEPGT